MRFLGGNHLEVLAYFREFLELKAPEIKNDIFFVGPFISISDVN